MSSTDPAEHRPDPGITHIEPDPLLSAATVHGGIVYLSGLAATDLSADVAGQTRQTLAEIDRVLALAGSGKERLLRVEVYLADIRDFAAMNAIYTAWTPPGRPPARVCSEARLWDPRALVEIMATAAI